MFSILMSVKSWAAFSFVFCVKNKKYSKNPGLIVSTIRLDLSVVCWSKVIICVLIVRKEGLGLSNASGMI